MTPGTAFYVSLPRSPAIDLHDTVNYVSPMRTPLLCIALPVAVLAVWIAPSVQAQLMDASAIAAARSGQPSSVALSNAQATGRSPHVEFAHSQIMAVDTPEPRSAAAVLCAVFVGALAARQVLSRRQRKTAA